MYSRIGGSRDRVSSLRASLLQPFYIHKFFSSKQAIADATCQQGDSGVASSSLIAALQHRLRSRQDRRLPAVRSRRELHHRHRAAERRASRHRPRFIAPIVPKDGSVLWQQASQINAEKLDIRAVPDPDRKLAIEVAPEELTQIASASEEGFKQNGASNADTTSARSRKTTPYPGAARRRERQLGQALYNITAGRPAAAVAEAPSSVCETEHMSKMAQISAPGTKRLEARREVLMTQAREIEEVEIVPTPPPEHQRRQVRHPLSRQPSVADFICACSMWRGAEFDLVEQGDLNPRIPVSACRARLPRDARPSPGPSGHPLPRG